MNSHHRSRSNSAAAECHEAVSIVLNGVETEVRGGVSVAAALLLIGYASLGVNSASKESRGVFCGMGSCHECAVTVDGTHGVRSCITPVADGLVINIEKGATR